MRHQARNAEFSLTAAEIHRLISGAGSIRDSLLVEVLAYTGIRRAEVRSLCWEDLDQETGRLIIRHGKGGKQRIVLLPAPVVQRLAAWQASATGFLFPGRDGQAMSLRNINLILNKVGDRARVPSPNPRYRGVGPHLLRHSLARNWKRAGGSLESLKRILGHASLKTTLDLYGTEGQADVEANYRAMAENLVRSHFPVQAK